MTSQLRPTGSTTAWRRTRATVLHRDHHSCQYPVDGHACAPRPGIECTDSDQHCGAYASTAGHVIPRKLWPPGKPGVDSPANVRAECARHNYRGGAELTNGKPAIDIPAYRTPLWEG
jgi:5-methylcytosine-specific restriction endonuclease McrA